MCLGVKGSFLIRLRFAFKSDLFQSDFDWSAIVPPSSSIPCIFFKLNFFEHLALHCIVAPHFSSFGASFAFHRFFAPALAAVLVNILPWVIISTLLNS